MAFVTATSQIRKNILNYMRHLVSKSTLKAIDYILSPCCENGSLTANITGLSINGVAIDTKKVKVVVLVEDSEASTAFGVGTTNSSGDVTLT